MLGRLEMDIDECILAYSRLIKTVFDEKSSRLPFGWRGKIKAQFNSARLESAIKEIITSRGLPEAVFFNDGTTRGCRV